MSDDDSSSQQRKQSDKKQRKADKRKKVEEEAETDTDKRQTDRDEEERTATQQKGKKSKRREVAEESKEAEQDEEEPGAAQSEVPSKSRVVVKKTTEGEEYIDVRQHIYRTATLTASTQCNRNASTHSTCSAAPCPQLSYKRRVAVRQFRGSLLIDIRETYEKFGEMQPGKTGIALNLEQWDKLKASVQHIDNIIARLK